VKQEIAAKVAEVDALFAGPFAKLLAPTETYQPDPATLAAIDKALRDLAAWKDGVKLPPFALSFSDQTEFYVRDSIKNAIAHLPKLPPAELAGLTPAAFAKLDAEAQRKVFDNAEGLGYTIDSYAYDDQPKKIALKILGPEKTKALLEAAHERAVEDSDNHEGKPKIGKPTVIEVEIVANGDQPIGYKFSAHCNWQPVDNDLLVDWWVDAKGKLFDEDFR
jgi:hypothetical protein